MRGRGPGPITAGAAAGAWTGYRLAHAALSAAPRPIPVQRSRFANTASAASQTFGSVSAAASRAVADFAGAKRELSDPLTPVLAVGSAASAVLGSPIDAVLVGSVLAATQRLRAERLLQRLLVEEAANSAISIAAPTSV